YRMLEVTRVMNSVLPDARWVSDEIVPEHLEIVAAFENADRDAARYLIRRHTQPPKATMRAAPAARAGETQEGAACEPPSATTTRSRPSRPPAGSPDAGPASPGRA